MIIFLSVARAMGLGADVGVLVFVVGLVDTESMLNVFFTVAKTGVLRFLLQELFFRTIILHPLLSFFLSTTSPANHQLLPKSYFSAYLPNSA
jgi:hypothetical protein